MKFENLIESLFVVSVNELYRKYHRHVWKNEFIVFYLIVWYDVIFCDITGRMLDKVFQSMWVGLKWDISFPVIVFNRYAVSLPDTAISNNSK